MNPVISLAPGNANRLTIDHSQDNNILKQFAVNKLEYWKSDN